MIGLNLYHADSSAALLIDGNIVCAMEEERFKRVKHWAGLPLQSIEFCLEYAECSIHEIDVICVGRNPSAKLFDKAIYTLTNFKSSWQLLKGRFMNKSDIDNIQKDLAEYFGYSPRIEYVEHHRAHLASAFYSSPFEKATIISIDGSGDFSTLMIGKGEDRRIEVLASVNFPVSIGLFYTAFTQYLGFPYYGDEYKVMGLSPYGTPRFVDSMEKMLWFDDSKILSWNNEFFNVDGGVVSYDNNIPIVDRLFNKEKFENLFGQSPRSKNEPITQFHKDIAASLQRHTENIIFKIINHAIGLTGIKNLCIAGGVAQNSVANGKIINHSVATDLYIPSAGHDAGISMGAAQYEYFHNQSNRRVNPLFDANLGCSFTNEQIKSTIIQNNLEAEYMTDDILFRHIAEQIANEKVVGFFDGRAEFGPRALGSRSILADPRNKNAQQLLNEKIKKRESFRPFAPSILEEFGSEFFEDYQFTPFMERVLKIRKEKQRFIPAVTHVDGSGRLQSVSKDLRPRYHQLISEFYKITGVPILINTSFNENEPVVNAPLEAINTFLRTDLDVLVLGNYVLSK